MHHYEQDVPNGWAISSLDNLATFGGGKTPSMDNKEYWNHGKYLWITSKDMKFEHITDSMLKISDVALEQMTIYEKDTLLVVTRSGILRHTLPIAILDVQATVNQDIKAISCYMGEIHKYIYYAIKAQENQILEYYHKDGTTVDSIDFDKFKKLPIPLPPLAEQLRIIEAIERWFALIDTIEKSKEGLETAIKQTKSKILDIAIHGKLVQQDPKDEPASELLKCINPKAQIPCDNEHSEKFPQDWEHILIGDYVETVTDFVANGSFASLRENVKYYNEPNYAILVRTKDFQNNFKQDLVYTDPHGYEFLAKSNLFGGELIFSNVGSIGKIFIVPELNQKMTLAPNAIMVRFHNDKQQKWFYYLFLSTIGQNLLDSITSATAIEKFNKTDFKKLSIPIPPLAEQQRIVQKIETLFSVLDNIQETLEVS